MLLYGSCAMAQARANETTLPAPKRVRRTAAVHPPGFYKALHYSSSVDAEIVKGSSRARLPTLRLADNASLPQDVYRVDRVVALKKKPVSRN